MEGAGAVIEKNALEPRSRKNVVQFGSDSGGQNRIPSHGHRRKIAEKAVEEVHLDALLGLRHARETRYTFGVGRPRMTKTRAMPERICHLPDSAPFPAGRRV